eukprot:m.85489 g.85489  ORF g.85489 m.85489 type:complete len:81 (-) comp9632_c0_seq3:2034-2276(-)
MSTYMHVCRYLSLGTLNCLYRGTPFNSLRVCVRLCILKTGRVVQTCTAGGGIFEVCWNKDGKRLAACCQDSTVLVVDFNV